MLRYILVVGLLTACAPVHPHQDVRAAALYGYCEHAQSLLQENPGPNWQARVKQAIGVPTSIALTGLGYVADTTVAVGGTVLATAVVCSPLLALEIAAKGNGEAAGRCMAEIGGRVVTALPSSGLGKAIYGKSRRWRCADMTPTSREQREVAQCWARRMNHQSVALARRQLLTLRDSTAAQCISEDEQQSIEQSLQRILAQGG